MYTYACEKQGKSSRPKNGVGLENRVVSMSGNMVYPGSAGGECPGPKILL